jgi:hypothetical protein
MKSFKEFLDQIYVINEGQTKQKKSLLHSTLLGTIRGGRTGGEILDRLNNIARSNITSTGKKLKERRRKETIEMLRPYYDDAEYRKAQKKAKKIRGAGMETHHITPLNYSRKLMSQMTADEWNERVRRDAESGIYHGHHHKNLMGTVTDKTPEERSRRGIRHRTGGAHELERKTMDLHSTAIPHKDLIAADHRMRIRNQRRGGEVLERMKKARGNNDEVIRQMQKAKTASDIGRVLSNS